ncbi:MAG: hypothetical protein LBT45_02345 [Rickettsiales bacterium]|jgi:hypothetical protein|nr:hypothetical protein [Rickettsiales bacterium]
MKISTREFRRMCYEMLLAEKAVYGVKKLLSRDYPNLVVKKNEEPTIQQIKEVEAKHDFLSEHLVKGGYGRRYGG